MMNEALRFSQSHGVRAGCEALDLPLSSLYREKLRRERPAMQPRPRPPSPRSLSRPEKEAVVEVLHCHYPVCIERSFGGNGRRCNLGLDPHPHAP